MQPDLKALLYLIYTAADRYRVVRITWRRTYHRWGLQELYQRKAAALPPGSFTYSSLENWPEKRQHRYAVYWEKGKRFRFDQWYDHDRYTRHVIQQDRRWSFTLHPDRDRPVTLLTDDPTLRHNTFDVVPGNLPSLPELFMQINPLDPAFMLAVYRMTPVEKTEYINRTAIRVDASYERNREIFWLEDHIWTRADRYRLLVDAERGIVLRCAAVIDAQEVVIEEVEEVVFDELLRDEVFQIPADPSRI